MKSRLILILCFLLAFAAGICAGVLWQRAQRWPPDPWLRELNLTPVQRDRIREIWSQAMKTGGWQAQREKREAAHKEYEDAIRKLITGEQQQRFDEIVRAYQKKLDDIALESRKVLDEADQRMQAEMTPEQRAKHEQLRKRHMGEHGRMGGGPPGPPPLPPNRMDLPPDGERRDERPGS